MSAEVESLISRKITGYICLLFVVLLLVLSSLFLKDLQTGYSNSFALTYFNYSFCALLLVIKWAKEKICLVFNRNPQNQYDEDISPLKNSNDNLLANNDKSDKAEKSKTIEYRNDFRKYVICLMIFWYFGNCFYNIGLKLVNISFANTISNLSIFFILIEKILIFQKHWSIYKILGLISAFSGLICLTLFQSRGSNSMNSFLGDFYLVIGALSYSFYAILLKFFSKKYDFNFDMTETFGYIGLYNFLLIPILLFILSITGIEVFIMPDPIVLFKIFLNSLFAAMIGDLLQSYCIILLAPHIVSFGLTLAIPLSVVFDLLFPFSGQEITLNLEFILGTSLLFLSVIIIVYESYEKLQNKIKKKREEFLTLQNDKESNHKIFNE